MSRAAKPVKPATSPAALRSQPRLHQHNTEIQAFGTVRQFSLGLSYEARMYSCQRLNQLLEAHEIILSEAHDAATRVAALGDDGTNDLIVSNVIRTGEIRMLL